MDISEDINTISTFISCEDIPDLATVEPVDCIVLCVSSVLHSCSTVFETIVQHPQLTKTLVLCGGIGHSTTHIYDAVAQHPRFKDLASEIQDLPEAQVLNAIYRRFYLPRLDQPGPKVLLEDRSTTCATNAVEAKKLLENEGEHPRGSVIVIQDPTMVRRTVECFKKVYFNTPEAPHFLGCPIFVPLVQTLPSGDLGYATPDIPVDQMWAMDRFLELIMGEIPRMRDDENGYGPKGKGHLLHVNIPQGVEEAYQRLVGNIPHRRGQQV